MTKKGAGTGGMEYSPGRRRRMAQNRRRQEERWAAKAGPVVVTRRGEESPTEPLSDDGAPPALVKDGTEPQAVLDQDGGSPKAGS